MNSTEVDFSILEEMDFKPSCIYHDCDQEVIWSVWINHNSGWLAKHTDTVMLCDSHMQEAKKHWDDYAERKEKCGKCKEIIKKDDFNPIRL